MQTFSEIDGMLPQTQRVGDFQLRFGARDPRVGRGLGVHGVTSERLIDSYVIGLEGATSTLRDLGWRLAGELVKVLICEPSVVSPRLRYPLTFRRGDGRPVVVLLSQPTEPDWDKAMARATIEAAHEATHAFDFPYYRQSRELGYDWLKKDGRWRWLDEATAVFVERRAFPEIADSLRYARWWTSSPEQSLDDANGWYEQGFFMQYMVDRFGEGFLSRLWTGKQPSEDPFHGIQRALGSIPFCSPDPDVNDAFGAGYCVDTYFTRNTHPDVAVRFGNRAVAWSFELDSPTARSLPAEDTLDHLACKYYRVFLKQPAVRLRVVVTVFPSEREGAFGTDAEIPLKATLAQVGFFGDCRDKRVLRHVTAGDGSQPPQLVAELRDQNPAEFDHLALTVANCGMDPEHDRRRFTVEFQAGS